MKCSSSWSAAYNPRETTQNRLTLRITTQKSTNKACTSSRLRVKCPRNTAHGALAQLVERLHRTQQVRGSNPLCSIKKAPISGAFFMEQFRGFSPPARCERWVSSPVHRVPAGHERLLSTRGSPVGSRAPRGEDTSEPIPRPLPGASGAVRSANGRVDSPIHPQKPNQKTIWFGFCFVLIFNTYARLGIAHKPAHRPAVRKTAPKGQKAYYAYPSRRRK